MKRIAILGGLLAIATLAHAQNQVSWVASNGFDANTCIRTSPCRTFQAAYQKTDVNGTIRVVDAADYGPLTISKSMTVDGGSSGATIVGLASDAITITTGPSDTVNIRNLTIHQLVPQFIAIVMFLGGYTTVNIENVSITATLNNQAFVVLPNGNDSGANTQVNLRNVSLSGTSNAMNVSVGQFTAERLSINSIGGGLVLGGNMVSASIRDSVFRASNGNAFVVTSAFPTQLPKSVMIERCEISQSVGGLSVFQGPQIPPVTVRLSNSVITGNHDGVLQNGGTLLSFRNNIITGNVNDGVPPLTTSLK